MSYEIIKSIVIKDGKVIVRASSNNVSPKDYEPWECPSLTKILNEEGQEAFDLAVMKDYESGSFQRGNNKWTRALAVLRRMPEYQQFNWRGEPYDEICKRRKSPEFTQLLKAALATKTPHEKFICVRQYGSQPAYLWRVSLRFAKFTYDKSKAKVFSFRQDIEELKSSCSSGTDWNIEQIA